MQAQHNCKSMSIEMHMLMNQQFAMNMSMNMNMVVLNSIPMLVAVYYMLFQLLLVDVLDLVLVDINVNVIIQHQQPVHIEPTNDIEQKYATIQQTKTKHQLEHN
jgi:hypothetical protein